MKKISLKNLNLREVEQLSRSQLKEVLGGFISISDSTDGTGTGTDCAVSCEQAGSSCTTSDCNTGTCAYSGISLVCVAS